MLIPFLTTEQQSTCADLSLHPHPYDYITNPLTNEMLFTIFYLLYKFPMKKSHLSTGFILVKISANQGKVYITSTSLYVFYAETVGI